MTPIVFLPGMMCDGRLYTPQIEMFSSRYPIHIGALHMHSSIEDMANSVLATAPLRFSLVGLSMGGIVAMEILRQAPERVVRLALLDTEASAEHEKINSKRLSMIQMVRDGGLSDVMRQNLLPHYVAEGPRAEGIQKLCLSMAMRFGPDVFIRQSQALMSRPDQSKTLRACKVPALILCGRDDAMCPVSRHEEIHEFMPEAAFEVIEGAGHLPVLEAPEQTNAALEKWLLS